MSPRGSWPRGGVRARLPVVFRRAQSQAFQPTSISNLALWLDASDESQVTVGTGVSTWKDKSGNGRNATQAVANKQPAYTNSINGRRVVTFQGTDDTMQIAANAAFNASSQTIVIVSRQSSSANQALWYKADSNSATGVIMRYRSGVTFWPYQKNDVSAETLSYNANTNTNTNVYVVVLQPSSQEAFINGISRSSAAVTTAYDNNSGPWLGSRRDVGEYLAGDIAEVLFWSRALLSSERRSVEAWLGERWGVAVA